MRILMAVAVLVAVGCGAGCNAAGAFAPEGAAMVDLGPRFAAAWDAVEQCSGLIGDRDAVEVFSVPGDFVTMRDGRRVVAYWTNKPTSRIYIASFYLTSDPAIRHEILHALLRRGEHPAEYFVTRCGSLVGTVSDS